MIILFLNNLNTFDDMIKKFVVCGLCFKYVGILLK